MWAYRSHSSQVLEQLSTMPIKAMMFLKHLLPFKSQMMQEKNGFPILVQQLILLLQCQLFSASPYHGNEIVLVGNGNQLPITHVGSTVITTPQGGIPLLDVLVCLAIQKSLLSISKLCDDYPCGVFFYANWVYVIDLKT